MGKCIRYSVTGEPIKSAAGTNRDLIARREPDVVFVLNHVLERRAGVHPSSPARPTVLATSRLMTRGRFCPQQHPVELID